VACPSSYRSIEKFGGFFPKFIRPRRSQSAPRRNLLELKSRDIEFIKHTVNTIQNPLPSFQKEQDHSKALRTIELHEIPLQHIVKLFKEFDIDI